MIEWSIGIFLIAVELLSRLRYMNVKINYLL